MSGKVLLNDGTRVVIRAMRAADSERSWAFFQALSPEDRAYLRRDITSRKVVEARIEAMQAGKLKRLVAVADKRIVADAALELQSNAWEKHVGELRMIVATDYRRKGLGRRMARELYSLAAKAKIEELIVKIMRPQVAARSIFRRLGFQETLMPDYVKDLKGQKHDLILMRCDLEAMWRELEDYIVVADWQRVR